MPDVGVFTCGVGFWVPMYVRVYVKNDHHPVILKQGTYCYFQALEIQPGLFVHMAAANSTPPGSLDLNQPGFAKEILGTKLEVKYLCSDCKNILRRPFQAQCGHRYCSYCLKKIISAGPQKCASCIQEGIYEEGISILETSSAFPDNAARREVESLPAVCINSGCTWKGTIKEYEAHDEVCPEFPLTCEGCGKKVPREKFRDHVKTCGRSKVPCRFEVVGCAEVVENEKLPEHKASAWRSICTCC